MSAPTWTKKYPKLFARLDDFSTGDGWDEILKELSERLEPFCDDEVYAVQVKEKFGGLCFYMSRYMDEIQDLITYAENTCWITCERCGQPGEYRDDLWWVRTLCDDCRSGVPPEQVRPPGRPAPPAPGSRLPGSFSEP